MTDRYRIFKTLSEAPAPMTVRELHAKTAVPVGTIQSTLSGMKRRRPELVASAPREGRKNGLEATHEWWCRKKILDILKQPAPGDDTHLRRALPPEPPSEPTIEEQREVTHGTWYPPTVKPIRKAYDGFGRYLGEVTWDGTAGQR